MKRCCTGLALLVLLAGCGGDGSPSTPVPINGLLVMVSSEGFFYELTSGGASGQTCGKLRVDMHYQETQGGPCTLIDSTLVLTDKTGARVVEKAEWSTPLLIEAHRSGQSFSDMYRCLVLPATWDYRVNTTDAAGTVTQLHGSGQIEIRIR